MPETSFEIVKVQRPISSSHPDEPVWLVYAKGHDRQTLIPEDKVSPLVKIEMGADYKGYFRAVWDGKTWGIGTRTEEQEW